jgi:transposase, IS30 family
MQRKRYTEEFKAEAIKQVVERGVQFDMNRLNNRPRKRLGFRTPNEVFFGKQEIALTG